MSPTGQHPDALAWRIALLDKARGFAAAAWVAIATVLLCALLPTGLPRTTATGSAFNPATTTVALQAGSPQTRFAARRISDDGAGAASVVETDASLLPGHLPPTVFHAPAPQPLPAVPEPSALDRLARLRVSLPRGPPLP